MKQSLAAPTIASLTPTSFLSFLLKFKKQNIFNNLGLTQGATIQLDLAPPSDGSPRLKVAVRPRGSSSSSSSSSGASGGGNVEPELLPLYSNGDPIAGEVREREISF